MFIRTAGLLLLSGMLQGAPDGLTRDPVWTFGGNFGTRFLGDWAYDNKGFGDFNADGFADLLVHSLRATRVFHGSAAGLSRTRDWKIESTEVTLRGMAAGDLNGDGFDDALVMDSEPGTHEPFMQVYLGSPAGLMTQPAQTIRGNLHFRGTRADFNGDGFADVFAYEASPDPHREPTVPVVHYGGPSGVQAAAGWRSPPAEPDIQWEDPAAAGDLDGDGIDDVMLLGTWRDPAFTGTNQNLRERYPVLYFVRGGSQGLATSWSWRRAFVELRSDGSYLNYMTAFGDVNNDGFDDFGFRLPGPGPHAQGSTVILAGSPQGPVSQPLWVRVDETGGAHLWAAGDVNGDGFDDVLLTDPWRASGTAQQTGKAWLFLGGPQGPAQGAAWESSGEPRPGSWFGSGAWGGDVNGDGLSDVAIGAPGYHPQSPEDGNVTYEDRWGKVYLFNGVGTPGAPQTGGGGSSDPPTQAPGSDSDSDSSCGLLGLELLLVAGYGLRRRR